MLRQIDLDVRANGLGADKITEELFALAELIDVNADIIEAARRRDFVGNPPGKKGSQGDAINWEALLAGISDGEDLYLISADGDFASVYDDDDLHEFLEDEWRSTKGSEVLFYKRLSAFLAEHWPGITLATELEKELLIKQLASSGSFAETHRLVGKLQRSLDYTDAQAQAILQAATSNNQVYWIIEDADVQEFLTAIAETYKDRVAPELLAEFWQLLEEDNDPPNDDDDLPF